MHTSWLWARFTMPGKSCSQESLYYALKAGQPFSDIFYASPQPPSPAHSHLSFKATSFSISPLFEKLSLLWRQVSCLAFIILVKDSDILPFSSV